MKPTIPDVADRFIAYHERNPSWGALHLVLDDLNLSDSDVWFCVDWANREGDSEGEELAKVLLSMSRTQRGKIARTL